MNYRVLCAILATYSGLSTVAVLLLRAALTAKTVATVVAPQPPDSTGIPVVTEFSVETVAGDKVRFSGVLENKSELDFQMLTFRVACLDADGNLVENEYLSFDAVSAGERREFQELAWVDEQCAEFEVSLRHAFE